MVGGTGAEEVVVTAIADVDVDVGVVAVVDFLVVDLLVEVLVVEELDDVLVDREVAGAVDFVTSETEGSVASVVSWS